MLSNAESTESNEQKSQHLDERMTELYPKLQKYCQFLTQSKWDGEDLVQESLLKAWVHYRNAPEVSHSLVNKMAYNHWIDTVRKRQKETLLSDINSELTTDDSDQAEMRLDLLSTLLTELTPKQTVVLTLKEAFLFQNHEIAEILDSTETSVKSILHRAKQRLKNEKTVHLLPIWDEEEQVQLRNILNQSLLTQDPTILIQAIPLLRSLQSETKTPTCILQKSRRSQSPSSTVYMAA
ncbi:sigma-70 family RNA polymerase sigma factor [Bacillus sp. BGMRC 2118]|nr:sigma-70 family RNA polymerase sigma factor [Bacillus sp. BGMRC 2118]